MVRLRVFAALLVLIFGTTAGSALASAPNANLMPPKLELSVYSRSFTPDEQVSVSLNGFNVKAVTVNVFHLDLGSLIPNSTALSNFETVIARVKTASLRRQKTFRYSLGHIYPDDWTECDVKTPKLPVGVYLITASSQGVSARTWFAVTDISLIAKRSRQELLVYAAQVHSGRPIPGAHLTAVDYQGHRYSGATGSDGVWRLTLDVPDIDAAGKVDPTLWICGGMGDRPAFVFTGAPDAPPPYTVYAYTDRPVYRPGQTVDFKGIVRHRVEADAPGGFRYVSYGNAPATIEIRDATDALISTKRVTTNAFGSFNGDVELAPEPVLGSWQVVLVIGEFRSYSNFSVQDYRKPEYTADVTFDRSHYMTGDVIPVTISGKYFFGQPVVGASVHYTIDFTATPLPGQPSDRGAEPSYTGDGVTDSSGKLTLSIPTKHIPIDRTVSVSAVMRDLSRREVDAGGSALITAGMFTLSLDTDQDFYRVGEKVNVTVHAADYDDKPLSEPVTVTLIEGRYDNQNRYFEERTSKKLQTGADGDGVVAFTPVRPGDFALQAVAYDQDDNKIEGFGQFTVSGDDDPDFNCPTIDLKANHDTYRAGDTATLVIDTNLVTPAGTPKPHVANGEAAPVQYREAWALVTVEGERLYDDFVVPLHSRTTAFQLPLRDSYFPAVQVSAVMIQEKQMYEAQAELNITMDQQKLQVTITPDKSHYAPGDQATYTVTTRDWKGRPVPADVSLGVVDASIYQVQPDNTTPIEDAFYSQQSVRVETDFSFAAEYSGGGVQSIPAAQAGAAAGGIRVRKQFADTSSWTPSILTDANGTGSVSFTVPDNLTTWRATARGITMATQVGQSTNDVISSMPLMVRLDLPRFYVEGDDTVVSAIVNNAGATDRTVAVSLKATGLTVTGSTNQSIVVPAGGAKRIDWNAHVTGPDVGTLQVVADGGAGAQDATESSLPVAHDGLAMFKSQTWTLAASQDSANLDLTTLPKDAAVTITLAPSVASTMFTALDYLTDYPYGCAEQTMSALLPDVMVGRALSRLHVNYTLHADPNKLVNFGLQKLYRYQHADGGWNWWEDDQSTPEMTAYVLWGLCEARNAGYTVDPVRITRGAGAVKRFIEDEQDPSDRAEYLLALADADANSAAKPLEHLYAKRENLDVYGLASLALALHEAGGKLAPEGDAVAREIEAQALTQANFVYWNAGETGYTWHADSVFVTAHCLRAVLAADPGNVIIPGVVRWLMAQYQYNSWGCTRTTAEVVFALTQYMEQSGEIHPDYTASVIVDGKAVGQPSQMTTASVFADPVTIKLTPADLAAHKTLTISKQGDGVLYADAGISYTVAPADVVPAGSGLTVQRQYTVRADDPSQANVLASGSAVDVTVQINSDVAYPYAMVEEPIPAGCEVVDDDSDSDSGSPNASAASRMEVRDDKIVFFFDNLPAGPTTVTYSLRMETPGSYRILPSIASLVYHPEFRGNDGLARAVVKDAP